MQLERLFQPSMQGDDSVARQQRPIERERLFAARRRWLDASLAAVPPVV